MSRVSRRIAPSASIALALALVVGLSTTSPSLARGDEPDIVTVQHILIGYKGSVPGKEIERTKREARALAEELYERATSGEDFDALVKEYTDDSYPGIYTMTNFDAPLMPQTFPRDRMAPGFGHVSFRLEVGEVGMTKYHAANSPYGWHIIRRVE